MGMSLVSSTLLAQEDAFKLDFDTLDEITFRAGNYPGWYGSFRSDGSAILIRSDEGVLSGIAVAPVGSFSLKKIYDLVAPHLKRPVINNKEFFNTTFLLDSSPPTKKKEVLNITFRFDRALTNRETEVHFYIEDKRVMRKLMHGLRDKVVPWDKPKFEEFLSQYPLVPGDEPAPFRYGSKRNISKWLYGGILAALCAGAVLWLTRKKK